MPAYCKACGTEAPGISPATLTQSGWTLGWPWSNVGWMCPVCRGADYLVTAMEKADREADAPDAVCHCGLGPEDHKLGGAAEHNYIPNKPGYMGDINGPGCDPDTK